MKTTIDIADDLIKRAKAIQTRDDVTFRSLVEEGLRNVLDGRARAQKKYKFVPIVAGKPYKPGMKIPDVRAMIVAANERPWLDRDLAAALGVGRVSEKLAAYKVAKPSARNKRKK